MECRLPDEVALARLTERELRGLSISDGRAALYPAQKLVFEAIDELPAHRDLVVQTDRLAEQLVDQVLADSHFSFPSPLFSLPSQPSAK